MSNDTQEKDKDITNEEIRGIVKSSMDAMDNAFNAGIDAAIGVCNKVKEKVFYTASKRDIDKVVNQLTQLKKETK